MDPSGVSIDLQWPRFHPSKGEREKGREREGEGGGKNFKDFFLNLALDTRDVWGHSSSPESWVNEGP